MKPFIRSHSKRNAESNKNIEPEKTKLKIDRKFPKPINNESEIRSSRHIDEFESHRNCNQLQPSVEMNNSAILAGLKESEWSYENYGFYSLPSRGYKKTRRPNIKLLINSDTVSQTKTIFYRDYHPENHTLNINYGENNESKFSNSNSSSSLNSDNEPEIVAAIDQIASQMGLIETPVCKQSRDPLHYLLTTRSFSERISTNRNSFNSHLNKFRPQSLSNHSKQVQKLNESENISNDQTSQEINKKPNKITKFFQRLSPKIRRKSKSLSNIDRNSFLTKNNLQSKNLNANQNISVKNEDCPKNCDMNSSLSENRDCQHRNSNKFSKPEIDSKLSFQIIDPIRSPESIQSENSNNFVIRNHCFNDNTKRLLNSLKVDRIDEPQIKFRNMSRRRADEKNDNQTFVGNQIKDLSINIPENSTIQKEKPVKHISQEVPQRPVSANASYVQISLSAFGYGAHQSTYKSPFDKKSLDLYKDRHNSSLI